LQSARRVCTGPLRVGRRYAGTARPTWVGIARWCGAYCAAGAAVLVVRIEVFTFVTTLGESVRAAARAFPADDSGLTRLSASAAVCGIVLDGGLAAVVCIGGACVGRAVAVRPQRSADETALSFVTEVASVHSPWRLGTRGLAGPAVVNIVFQIDRAESRYAFACCQWRGALCVDAGAVGSKFGCEEPRRVQGRVRRSRT
jgi:hypothetical protein